MVVGEIMRLGALFVSALLLMATGACARYGADSNAREREAARERRDAAERTTDNGLDTAARKAGKAAHEIADETRRAAAKAAVKLREAGHEARQGWKDADHPDRGKPAERP